MTGLPNTSGDSLGYVLYYCMKNRLPLLSSLVINQETGEPSYEAYKGMALKPSTGAASSLIGSNTPYPRLRSLTKCGTIRRKFEKNI